MSTPDDTRGLLGAYALDAVDDVERRAVDRLVASDEDAARELADLRAVAAELGAAVRAEPPAGLRDAVLAEIARTPQQRDRRADAPRHVRASATVAPGQDDGAQDDGAPGAGEASDEPQPAGVTSLASRRPSRGRWLAVAAALVVGAAVPSTIAIQQHDRAQQAEQQSSAMASVLRDPSAVVVHGDVQGGGTATAVLADGQAAFSATDLPDPGADKVYQLWVVAGKKATSAGVLDDADGSVQQLAGEFASGDALAMTVEPAGGSQQPTTDPVVVLSHA